VIVRYDGAIALQPLRGRILQLCAVLNRQRTVSLRYSHPVWPLPVSYILEASKVASNVSDLAAFRAMGAAFVPRLGTYATRLLAEALYLKLLKEAGLPLSPTVEGKLCHDLFLEFEAEPG
jgi:hypothetical protein